MSTISWLPEFAKRIIKSHEWLKSFCFVFKLDSEKQLQVFLVFVLLLGDSRKLSSFYVCFLVNWLSVLLLFEKGNRRIFGCCFNCSPTEKINSNFLCINYCWKSGYFGSVQSGSDGCCFCISKLLIVSKRILCSVPHPASEACTCHERTVWYVDRIWRGDQIYLGSKPLTWSLPA